MYNVVDKRDKGHSSVSTRRDRIPARVAVRPSGTALLADSIPRTYGIPTSVPGRQEKSDTETYRTGRGVGGPDPNGSEGGVVKMIVSALLTHKLSTCWVTILLTIGAFLQWVIH